MIVYGWQRFYEAAILETNVSRLPNLIQSAEAAIKARVNQLVSDHGGSQEERAAIEDAMAGLRILREEVTRGLQGSAASS